jgi:hypothetical protein
MTNLSYVYSINSLRTKIDIILKLYCRNKGKIEELIKVLFLDIESHLFLT